MGQTYYFVGVLEVAPSNVSSYHERIPGALNEVALEPHRATFGRTTANSSEHTAAVVPTTGFSHWPEVSESVALCFLEKKADAFIPLVQLRIASMHDVPRRTAERNCDLDSIDNQSMCWKVINHLASKVIAGELIRGAELCKPSGVALVLARLNVARECLIVERPDSVDMAAEGEDFASLRAIRSIEGER